MPRRNFGAIRKMRSGRFQASYVVNGERFPAPHTFQTSKDADAWLAETRSAITRGEWLRPDMAGQTFRHYALTWFSYRKDSLAPKTARLYASTLDTLLLPYFGPMSMRDISPLSVKQWRLQLINEYKTKEKTGKMPNRRSTGTTRIAQAYRLLHTIMAEAERDEVIRHNPCVIKGASSSRAAERKPATLEELDVIARNMPDRYHAIIPFAAWSGLRFSEIAGLRRKDIALVADVSANELVYRINVDKQTYRIGTEIYEEAAPKTSAGHRVVYLPAHLTPVLMEHMAKYVNEPQESYVFSSRNNTPIRNNVIGKMFRAARKAAGRDDLRFHDLRHTGATMAAKAGATTKELMQRMGHSSPRAALIYQHADERGDMELAARMEHHRREEQRQEQRIRQLEERLREVTA